MGEFRIDRRIRNIAAGRDVEIMQGHGVAQSRPLAQHGRDVTAIGLAAIVLCVEGIERQAREQRDSVIALLSVEGGVLIAEPLEPLERKLVVRAFGFLQTKDVRTDRLDELGHEIDAQPHRIDVPCGDGKTHGRGCDLEHVPVNRNQPEPQARPAPSPLVGEGWGGGSLLLREARPPTLTPAPNPSPQGGGEFPQYVAPLCINGMS